MTAVERVDEPTAQEVVVAAVKDVIANLTTQATPLQKDQVTEELDPGSSSSSPGVFDRVVQKAKDLYNMLTDSGEAVVSDQQSQLGVEKMDGDITVGMKQEEEQHEIVAFLLWALETGSSLAMIIGGVVPYIPQYLTMKEKGSAKGFSTYVCLALLVANTLRILFWFGKHYETPLLIQSILMNIAMFALIHLCVSLNKKEQIIKEQEKIFTDFELKTFWQWTDFQSYVECIMTLAVFGGVLMYFFCDFAPFVETIGFVSLFTEAMLGLPQFHRNFKNKSTYGMSIQMVLMWTCGDIFKTSYFILRAAPAQFFICGSLQVCIDLSILTQVFLYRENTNRRRKQSLHLHT